MLHPVEISAGHIKKNLHICVTRMISSDSPQRSSGKLADHSRYSEPKYFRRGDISKVEKCPQRVEYRGIATHEILQDDTHPVHGF
jgi:hypothetical protein